MLYSKLKEAGFCEVAIKGAKDIEFVRKMGDDDGPGSAVGKKRSHLEGDGSSISPGGAAAEAADVTSIFGQRKLRKLTSNVAAYQEEREDETVLGGGLDDYDCFSNDSEPATQSDANCQKVYGERQDPTWR